MKVFILLFVAGLVGCAQSSGAMKMGPDTYTISTHAAPALGGESGAKNRSLTEANSYCESMGKNIVVTSMETKQSSHLPGGTADITFMCLADGDPELQRPKYEPAADLVIESR